MVNLASNTNDDNKNILLNHSKKIRKYCNEIHPIKKIDPFQTHRNSFNPPKKQIPMELFHMKTNNLSKETIYGINKSQTSQFENYQPFYNLVFCPDIVQEIFSYKNSINILEMRRKISFLKTPLTSHCFEKNLDKMKILSSNQDQLIQNYLKDKYTNSEQPNPKLLREYYRYSKAKLSLSKNIEEQHQEKSSKIKSLQKIENQTYEEDEIFAENNKNVSNLYDWHDDLTQHHTYQNNAHLKNSFSAQVGIHDFKGIMQEEETKIQKINIKIEHVDCKKNFKQIEDIFSNENENSEQYESDEENTLKFAIANQKKGLSWFNEDEFVEKERLYSIL